MALQFPGFSPPAGAGARLVVLAIGLLLSVAWTAPCAAAPKTDLGEVALEVDVPRARAASKAVSSRAPGPQLDVALAFGTGMGGGYERIAPMPQLAGTLVGSMMALGYRRQSWFLGATVLGALGNPSAEPDVAVCPIEGMDCRATLFRYGVQARYYLALPRTAVSPWLGVGLERELFQLVNASRGPDALYVQGNQLDLRFGLDVATRESAMHSTFFVDYALGRFAGGSLLTARGRELDESSIVHHWILLGGGLSWRP